MPRFLVEASWWVDAKDEEEAINKIENAVASKVDDADLEESEVVDFEEEAMGDE